MAHPFIEWLKRVVAENPEIMKILEESAGPYGQAGKQKVWEIIKPEPKNEGDEQPILPPGIFHPYPKAWEGQGDFSLNNSERGGVNNANMARESPGKDRIAQLASRVLGETEQEDVYGREKRPFYFG